MGEVLGTVAVTETLRLTIRYEAQGGLDRGLDTAAAPDAEPGRTREEARTNVLDALGLLLRRERGSAARASRLS